MESWTSRWTHCVFCIVGVLLAVRACPVPSKIQGNWDVMDSSGSTKEFTVIINSTYLTGVTFWDKSLTYSCYDQQGSYYVFRSEQTSLFDLYDVYIYFCWFLQTQTVDKYYLYELTDKVLYSVQERAKAYLNTTVPTITDVCEVTFDSSLVYKQMQYYLQRSGGNSGGNIVSISTSAFLILIFLALLV